MKIAILSRDASLYSTTRLREAAEARGHEARVVDYLRCYLNITSRRPTVQFQGRELEGFDAVIPRIGASHTFYGTAVVRQFELMGTFAANESQAITRSRDKLRSLQLLARSGIGLPVTAFAHSTKDIDGLLETVGGAPVIVKLLEGTQGVGVVLAETKKAAESVIAAFRQLDANILVQEYIKEAGGTDIRALVVGNRVVAAIERKRRAGRLPLEPAPRRDGVEGEAGTRGAQHRRSGVEGDGPEHVGRRHPALQPRTRRDGGEQLARARGRRDGLGCRRGGSHHRLPREERGVGERP